jgi:hypothetical protein
MKTSRTSTVRHSLAPEAIAFLSTAAKSSIWPTSAMTATTWQP